MATTKIFPITATEAKALAYIANPDKTNNGRLILTSGCSEDPYQASRDFEEIRKLGTGLSTVLSQHFIQSFAPGEITPEQALQVGEEMCERFLKGEYQYFLAVHNDRDHIHLHVIFNNVNQWNGRTFETNENRRYTQKDRSYNKLREISDKVCKEHNLSVIICPEPDKGMSYWEWAMNRKGLSWKAKLKYAIDQVAKQSDDFDDFLKKCRENGILVEYNPDHKIDLKFMLAEQKERNPRAKFTRAKTLGWYYETAQIKKRIDMYKGVMSYAPRARVKRTAQVQENKYLRDYIDRANMKQVSKSINIASKYGIRAEEIGAEAMAAFILKGQLSEQRNAVDIQLDDLIAQVKVLKKYRRLSEIAAELKTLSGRQAKQFRSEHSSELNEYGECQKQILEWYPSGHIPSVEAAEKKIHALKQEREQLKSQYEAVKVKAKELGEAQRDIDEYLRQERDAQQQKRKKNKNGDLE